MQQVFSVISKVMLLSVITFSLANSEEIKSEAKIEESAKVETATKETKQQYSNPKLAAELKEYYEKVKELSKQKRELFKQLSEEAKQEIKEQIKNKKKNKKKKYND